MDTTEENKQEKINSDSSLSYLIPILIGLMSWNSTGSSPDISRYELNSLRDRYHELDKRIALLEAKNSFKD